MRKMSFSPPIAPPCNKPGNRQNRPVIDQHEKMSMYAQSVTLPVGAEGRTGNAVAANVWMQDYFRELDEKLTEEHSPQFDRPIQFRGVNGVKACYLQIIDELDL